MVAAPYPPQPWINEGDGKINLVAPTTALALRVLLQGRNPEAVLAGYADALGWT